jgi:hypothetical protein
MLSNHINKILEIGDSVIGRIHDPIYSTGDQFTCRIELYTPTPVIYKVTLVGERSQKFRDTIKSLEQDVHPMSNKIFSQIKGIKTDITSANNFYLHTNSVDSIAAYEKIEGDYKVIDLRLTTDTDFNIIDMIANRANLLKSLDNINLDGTLLLQYYEKLISKV